jgi:transcriptional antiterminator RfaH
MRGADDSGSRQGGWAAVNTQPHRERVALENLMRQEFDVYCPLIRKRVRHARRAQNVLRPLFPGYVFVRVSLSAPRWRPILSTIGVKTLVRCGAGPSLIAHDFIESLKAREIDGAIARPARPYRIGQQVRIAGGAFDGIVATIIEMDERDRIVVLMDMLNRPVKAKLTARQAVSV